MQCYESIELMGFLIDLLLDLVRVLFGWRQYLILLMIILLGYCVYDSLFGVSP